jgi:serine/threonine protein kinase
MAVDVCRGMAFLHSAVPAILHRDLKVALTCCCNALFLVVTEVCFVRCKSGNLLVDDSYNTKVRKVVVVMFFLPFPAVLRPKWWRAVDRFWIGPRQGVHPDDDRQLRHVPVDGTRGPRQHAVHGKGGWYVFSTFLDRTR